MSFTQRVNYKTSKGVGFDTVTAEADTGENSTIFIPIVEGIEGVNVRSVE